MFKKSFLKALLISALVGTGSVFLSCGSSSGDNNTTSSGSTGGSTGGSGGSGGSTGGNVSNGGVPTTYLAYKGSLWLVDPNNPIQPTQIASGQIQNASYVSKMQNIDTTTYQYSGFYRNKLVYIQNGKMFSLNLKKTNTGQPTSQQISTLSDICTFDNTFEDNANGKTYFIVKTAGQDGQCFTNDDKKYFVNSNMVSSDTPIDLTNKDIIAEFSNNRKPQIDGFLVGIYLNTGYKVQKCDTTLANCTDLLTGITDGDNIGKDPVNNVFYACIKVGTNNPTVYKFDGNTLANTQKTCDLNIWKAEDKETYTDSTGIYMVIKDNTNPNKGKIYKFSFSNLSTTVIYNNGDAYNINGSSTKDRLIITTDSYSTKIISKTGNIVISSGISDIGYSAFNNDTIIYTKITSANPPSYELCVLKDSQTTPNCISNLIYSGMVVPNNGQYYIESNAIRPYKILVLKTDTKELFAVDPNNIDIASGTKLGILPSDINIVSGFGFGQYILLVGLGSNNNQDILFADVDTISSLTRITNTSNTKEEIIY